MYSNVSSKFLSIGKLKSVTKPRLSKSTGSIYNTQNSKPLKSHFLGSVTTGDFHNEKWIKS